MSTLITVESICWAFRRDRAIALHFSDTGCMVLKRNLGQGPEERFRRCEEGTDVNYTLLADDDGDFGSLLEAAYEATGMAAALRRVSDGLRAQRYLRGDGRYVDRNKFPFPKLVLLDLNLPRPDGWELLHWIRGQTSWAELRVVILSGMDLNGQSRRALELGADACWEKPFPFTGLVNMVEHFREHWLIEDTQMLRAA